MLECYLKLFTSYWAQFQIKRGKRDNLGIHVIFHITPFNISIGRGGGGQVGLGVGGGGAGGVGG